MKPQRAAHEVSGDNGDTVRNGINAYFVRGSFPNFSLFNSTP